MGKIIKFGVAGILVAVMVFAYLAWSRHAKLYPATQDAYLGANIVRIAPQVSGTIETVGPSSYSQVQKGDLLMQIDPRPFQAAVDQAEAGLAQARQQVSTLQKSVDQAEAELSGRKAALDNARHNAERSQALLAKGNMSKASAQQDEAALREAQSAYTAAVSAVARAKAALGDGGDGDNVLVKAAQARLEQAKLALSHTRIVAPADGHVGQVSGLPGGMAQAGVSFLQLVETNHWWVDANFKETDLARIHPGQTATVKVDMIPGKEFSGKVVSLSPASGASFSLFPPQNATGNWVKVAQRFPVRIDLGQMPKDAQFRVGASTKVVVNTEDK